MAKYRVFLWSGTHRNRENRRIIYIHAKNKSKARSAARAKMRKKYPFTYWRILKVVKMERSLYD